MWCDILNFYFWDIASSLHLELPTILIWPLKKSIAVTGVKKHRALWPSPWKVSVSVTNSGQSQLTAMLEGSTYYRKH